MVLAFSGNQAVDASNLPIVTTRLLGCGLIAVGLVATIAGVGLMRCLAWGWWLGLLSVGLFVFDGMLNGYFLFGRPGGQGAVVNGIAAALILACLLRGRHALERAPQSAPSA